MTTTMINNGTIHGQPLAHYNPEVAQRVQGWLASGQLLVWIPILSQQNFPGVPPTVLLFADRFQESMRWPIHRPEDLLQLPDALKETITDNPNIEGKDFGFSISNTNISAPTDGTSSRFSTFAAAQSAISTIVVDVTASSLVFTVQPQAVTLLNTAMNGVTVNAVMNAITVSGVDVNGNVDAD